MQICQLQAEGSLPCVTQNGLKVEFDCITVDVVIYEGYM